MEDGIQFLKADIYKSDTRWELYFMVNVKEGLVIGRDMILFEVKEMVHLAKTLTIFDAKSNYYKQTFFYDSFKKNNYYL